VLLGKHGEKTPVAEYCESVKKVTMFWGSERLTYAFGADRNVAVAHRPMAPRPGLQAVRRQTSAIRARRFFGRIVSLRYGDRITLPDSRES